MRRAPLLVVVLFACGGGGGAQPKLASKNQVDIVLTGPPIEMAFDAKSPRLEEASAQLHAIVAHPISFELDSGVFSESKDKFEDLVLADIEMVAADLAKLKKSAPLVFDHGVTLLEHVIVRYDATYAEPVETATLDPKTHALTINGRGGGWTINAGVISAALGRELEDYAFRHFGPAEPDALPNKEHAAYFEFLTDWHKRQKWLAAHPSPATTTKAPRSPDAELVRKIARLASLAEDPALNAAIRKWLFERMNDYESAYRGDADVIAALPENHEWRRAEAAYVAWLGARVPNASDEERLQIARSVFRDMRNAHPFPGFDRLGFGLGVIDEWIKAGSPTATNFEPQARRNLFFAVVCPLATRPDGTRETSAHCDHAFYREAIESEASAARFGEALLARADPKLAETAFVAIASLPRTEALAGLAAISKALDKSDALWRAGFRALGDEAAQIGAAAVIDEARRVWHEHPERRGVILYTLASIDRASPHSIDWAHFSASFGDAAVAADLTAMLDTSPRAMPIVHRVWPAFGPRDQKGWSRTQALAPYLTAFVDGERGPGEADESIRGIAHAMCEERGAADIRELVAFFDKRRAAHPAERYAKIVTEASTCKPTAP